MSRPVFSFRPNMEQPEHREAWGILKSVPERQKNQFIVRAILHEQEAGYLRQVIRETVREALDCGEMRQSVASGPPEQGDIPDQVLDFISALQGE